MAQKRVRELQKMVSRLTPDFEISVTRGSHYRVTVWGTNGRLSVITSGTGSDHREDKNFMAQIARAVLTVTAPARADYRPIPEAVATKATRTAAERKARKGGRK